MKNPSKTARCLRHFHGGIQMVSYIQLSLGNKKDSEHWVRMQGKTEISLNKRLKFQRYKRLPSSKSLLRSKGMCGTEGKQFISTRNKLIPKNSTNAS